MVHPIHPSRFLAIDRVRSPAFGRSPPCDVFLATLGDHGKRRGHEGVPAGAGSGPDSRISPSCPRRFSRFHASIRKVRGGINRRAVAFSPGTSRASHAVAAVEAAVAGAAADGQRTAVVAGGGVALEVGELAVLLAEALVDAQLAAGERLFGRLGADTVPMTASACSRSAMVAVRWPLTLRTGIIGTGSRLGLGRGRLGAFASR